MRKQKEQSTPVLYVCTHVSYELSEFEFKMYVVVVVIGIFRKSCRVVWRNDASNNMIKSDDKMKIKIVYYLFKISSR